MPFCPICKTEYIVGAAVCDECGSELAPELMEEIHFSSDDFSMVYTCDTLIEAEMIKANLESTGIETFVLNQQDRNYPGSGNIALIKVFVRKDNEEDAVEFLQTLNSSDQQNSDDTPKEI